MAWLISSSSLVSLFLLEFSFFFFPLLLVITSPLHPLAILVASSLPLVLTLCRGGLSVIASLCLSSSWLSPMPSFLTPPLALAWYSVPSVLAWWMSCFSWFLSPMPHPWS